MNSTIGLNFNDFDIKYQRIVTKAVVYLEEVINSQIFKDMLVDEISKSNGLEGELSHWKDAMPLQIYAQLFPIILYLNTYYTWSNVIGYGVDGTNQIYINTKYLSTYHPDDLLDIMEIGSNILHEHSHDCEFAHDYKSTSRRKNSLSYVLNRAYERAFKKFYNLEEPEDEVVYYTPWYRKVWSWIWN
jgi:hypothetical protein